MENSFYNNNRILFKGLLICFLAVLLLIPTLLIIHLVEERQTRQQEAIAEVSSKWANQQTIIGPAIAVPYWQTVTDSKGMVNRIRQKAYFLPNKLSVNGNIVPETRYRGIYQVTVYTTDMALSGDFTEFKFDELNIAPRDVIWNEAIVYFSVTDVRGLKEQVFFNWNGKNIELVP